MKRDELPRRLQTALEAWGVKEPIDASISRQGNIVVYRLPYTWDWLLQQGETRTIRQESGFPVLKQHQFWGTRAILSTGHGLSMIVNCVRVYEFYKGTIEHPDLPMLTLVGPHLLGFQNEEEVYPQIHFGPSNQRVDSERTSRVGYGIP